MTDRPDCDIPHGQNSNMAHRMDVAIATWQPEGIRRVEAMNLPQVSGVRYVVSWQLPGPDPVIPESLACRDDVSVFIIEKAGVSVNRNNACAHCTADIILNSDDDLVYTAEQLQSVIETFDRNPDVNLAAFQYNGAKKQYPAQECDLTSHLPEGYYGSLIEIAVRRKVFRKVTFDVNFGPGAPLFQCGEDTKFLFDVIRAGFHCRFFPITICTHDHPSTGDKPLSKGVALAEGKLIRLQYPASWILRVPLKAWRNKKKGGSLLSTLYYLLRGALIRI